MTGCWWPCCEATYNIRRYNSAGTVLWSEVLADGQSITHVDCDGDTMYVAAGSGIGNFLFAYDISGASPLELWKVASNVGNLGPSTTGVSDIKALPSGGGVLVLSRNTFNPLIPNQPPPFITEYFASGYYLMKYSAAGVLQWRRKIQYPNINSGIAYKEGNFQNSRAASVTVDSGGTIYVGTQYAYTTDPPIQPLPGRPVNILKLTSGGAFTAAYSGLTSAEITSLGGNVGFAPIFSIDTDSTNLYWCTIGKNFPSGITVVGAVKASDGTFPWSSPTNNKSRTFGWHVVKQFASGFVAAGRGWFSPPGGFTAAPFSVWAASTGIHSHNITAIDYSIALDVNRDGSPVTSLAANVDLDASLFPINEEWAIASAVTLPDNTMEFGGGSTLRAEAAYSFPTATGGHILGGNVITA